MPAIRRSAVPEGHPTGRILYGSGQGGHPTPGLLVRVDPLDTLGKLLGWENYSHEECGREIILEQPAAWQHR